MKIKIYVKQRKLHSSIILNTCIMFHEVGYWSVLLYTRVTCNKGIFITNRMFESTPPINNSHLFRNGLRGVTIIGSWWRWRTAASGTLGFRTWNRYGKYWKITDRNRYNERNQYACSYFYTDIYNNRLNTWSRGHVLLQNWRQPPLFVLILGIRCLSWW